jgi:hypothetical protein
MHVRCKACNFSRGLVGIRRGKSCIHTHRAQLPIYPEKRRAKSTSPPPSPYPQLQFDFTIFESQGSENQVWISNMHALFWEFILKVFIFTSMSRNATFFFRRIASDRFHFFASLLKDAKNYIIINFCLHNNILV